MKRAKFMQMASICFFRVFIDWLRESDVICHSSALFLLLGDRTIKFGKFIMRDTHKRFDFRSSIHDVRAKEERKIKKTKTRDSAKLFGVKRKMPHRCCIVAYRCCFAMSPYQEFFIIFWCAKKNGDRLSSRICLLFDQLEILLTSQTNGMLKGQRFKNWYMPKRT